MCTLKLFVILLLVLLVLGVLAFVLDSVKEKEIDNPNYPTRAYKIARGCSFIVKFGMILTACALVGSLAPAGLGLAMAFAIPKPTSVPKGSWFDHSHNVATTLPFGAIVPIDWRFLNAGEKVKQNLSGFCRALQLKAPAMQDIDLKWGTFFVPARILCDATSDIVSKPVDTSLKSISSDTPYDVISATKSSTLLFPYMNFDNDLRTLITDYASSMDEPNYATVPCAFMVGGLMDYLGFPCETFSYLKSNSSKLKKFNGSVPINLLPLMAYQSVCNHFFVDDCFRRSDALDMVNIPTAWTGLRSSTDVDTQGLLRLRFSQYESDPFLKASAASRINRINTSSNVALGDGNELDANKIRGMFALDEFARKVEYFYGDMRKQIKYMFGVITSDRSAMSPILVNAGSQPVQVSELNNTTMQDVDSEQTRQSAGKMLSSFGQHNKTFEAEELGIYITLAWIRPRTCYLNRFPHQFETYLDSTTIPNPLFSEIGDVTLMRRQIDFRPFDTNADYNVNTAFGYNSRYVLEKYTFDSFTGDFRDNLAYWHCAREFDSAASLTPSYVFRQVNPAYLDSAQSLNRIFSVISSVDGARPFQLQMRFNTEIWQLYPHIDDEL